MFVCVYGCMCACVCVYIFCSEEVLGLYPASECVIGILFSPHAPFDVITAPNFTNEQHNDTSSV